MAGLSVGAAPGNHPGSDPAAMHPARRLLAITLALRLMAPADPVWSQAQAQLQEAVKGKPGRPSKAEENAPHRGAISSPATSDANRHPKDRKSRLIRTLTLVPVPPAAIETLRLRHGQLLVENGLDTIGAAPAPADRPDPRPHGR